MARSAAELKIINYPDPRLRKTCKRVEEFGPKLAELAEHMLGLMREAQGVGLAAPQVGMLVRVFVCNVTGESKDDMVLVNPELFDLEGDIEGEEGCLSIPDVTVTMHRADSCVLRGQNLKGKSVELRAEGLLSRCFQHECDHLDGRLIIDGMSEADRIANRKVLRELERKHSRGAKAS